MADLRATFRCGPLAWSVMLLALVPVSSCTPGPGSSGGARFISLHAIDGACRTAIGQTISISSPIHDTVSNEIRITCARNESLGFFLRLQSGGGRFAALSISADSLTSDSASLDVSAIRFHRVLPVSVGPAPGWSIKAVDPSERHAEIPDILVPADAPVGGQPYALGQTEQLLLWVDVAIPSPTAPGHYSTMIRVQEGGMPVAATSLLLTVLPLTLPDNTGVELLGQVNLQQLLGHHLLVEGEPFVPDRVLMNAPLYQESVALVHSTLLMLQRHRINPVPTGVYPIAKLDDRGELLVKWDDYDALVGGFLEGKLYPRQPKPKFWPIPFDETFPSPPRYDPLSSPTYANTLRQYLTLCVEHFRERGWLDKAFLLLPPSTVEYSAGAFNTTKSYAAIARLASKELQLVSLLPPQDLRSYGWEGYPYVDLGGLVDTWCPSAQFFDPLLFSQPPYRTARKWFQLDRPPFSGNLSLAAGETSARVIPWQASLLRAEAVLLPVLNDWSDDYTLSSPQIAMSKPSPPLILPGKFWGLDTPVPTLRLKMLRRGMNDLAYLQLCEEAGLHSMREIILRSLCHFAGADAAGPHFQAGRFEAWQRDAQWWNVARTLMVEALLAKPSGSDSSADADLMHSLQWKRFLEASGEVRVRTIGVRVNLLPPAQLAGGHSFEVDVLLIVENVSHQPVTATASFGKLPMGWQPSLDGVLLESIEPYGSDTLTLRALARSIPAGNHGTLDLPIEIELEGGETITHAVRVSHITARRPGKPIVLDGDTSEWPAAIGNSVAGFRSISTPGGDALASTSERIVAGPTLGWVCADKDNVYFGFHCLTKGRHSPSGAQRNFLTIDDGVPVGEELLEILIDPTNGRSNSPAELFHIAIKPSGVWLAEQGIRSDPQIGFARNWPADVRVATRILDDRWVVELQVPRKALGPLARRQRSWAVNFCRFEADRRTYSTWSGALWNAYIPASFGNLSFTD